MKPSSVVSPSSAAKASTFSLPMPNPAPDIEMEPEVSTFILIYYSMKEIDGVYNIALGGHVLFLHNGGTFVHYM